MKRVLFAVLLLAAVLIGAPATFAQGSGGQTAPSQTKPLPSPDSLIALSKVEGSTYTNEFFGISFTAPKGWTILGVEVMKGVREKAKDVFRDEKDPKIKRELEATVDRTTPLFSASKLPPGTTGSFHAVVICAAEQIPTAVVKTPHDYYTLMLQSMKLSQGVNVEVVQPFQTKRIGTTDFGTYTLKITSNQGIMLQRQIVTIKAPYAFGIVFTYVEESDTKAFDELISSIKAK